MKHRHYYGGKLWKGDDFSAHQQYVKVLREDEGDLFKDLIENRGGPSAEIKWQRITRQDA